MSSVTQVGTPGTVQVQSGSNSGSVTGAWSGTQTRTAGHLLVACVTAWGATTASAISGPGGIWSSAVSLAQTNGRGTVAIFTGVALGSDAAPTFTATMTGGASNERMSCELFELSGQDTGTPIVTTGTGTSTTSPLSMTSGGNVNRSGSFGIDAILIEDTVSTGTLTFTADTHWTAVYNTGSTAARAHSAADTYSNPPTGSTLADDPSLTMTSGSLNGITGVMIVVQPPAAAGPAAVIPPHGPARIKPGPPRRGYGHGSQGTLSQAIAGVTGTITVTAPAGSVQAVTGSPGRVVRRRPTPQPGRSRTSPVSKSADVIEGLIQTWLFSSTLGVWGSYPAGASVALSTGWSYFPGSQSMLLTTNGSASYPEVVDSNYPLGGTLIPGQTYWLTGWAYSPQGFSNLYVGADLYNNATFVESIGSYSITLPAATPTYISTQLTIPPGVNTWHLKIGMSGTPPATQQLYLDYLNLAVTNPITVAAPAGSVQAVTGSPGQVVKGHRFPVPPGRRQGISQGTLGVTIAGVTGSITVTGIAGSVTAVTGSPGRLVRAQPRPRQGRSAGYKAPAVPAATGGLVEYAGAPWKAATSGNGASITSASFTPIANSLLVAIVSNGNGLGAQPTSISVTDSVSGTWTSLITDVRIAPSGGIFVKDAGPSPSAQTVTATWSPGTVNGGMGIIVRQFTGAAPAAQQNGVTAQGGADPGTVISVNITPGTTGSQVVGVYSNASNNITLTANGSTSIYGQQSDGPGGDTEAAYEASSLSTANTQITLGFTATGNYAQVFDVAEILPATTATAQAPATGRVISRKLPFSLRGYGKGTKAASPGTSTSVAGVAGTITVTGYGGTVQAVTGSPGQVTRSRTRMPPRNGSGHGSQGTLAATVAGVTGSITVTGLAGSVQAVTGSPGRIIRAQPGPRKGRSAGYKAQATVSALPSLSVVQSTGKAAASGNCTFTLTSTPTAGNALLAFCHYNDSFTLSAPSGSKWMLLTRTPLGNGGARMDVYWHIVQSGDGTSWTFPVTGDYTSGQLYEITGADNQFPVSGIAIGGSSTGVASIASPSATPAFTNSLAFAAETDNNGTSVSSATSGWTLLQDTGTYHGGSSAYNPTLTSSAASCTFTMSGTTGGYSDVTILISPAPATPATVYPLQNAVHQASGGNIVLTMSATPAAGNFMLAVVAWNGIYTQTPPTGWTQIFSVNNNPANDSLAAYYRVVQAGDGASYTWTLSGDLGSGELFEITGQAASNPVNGYQTATDDTTPTSRTTPSVTPTVLNCLALACETSDGTADAIASVSSGWSYNSGHGTYHGSSTAYRNTPTADTSTGISNTFTYTAASGPGSDATILIAPAGAAPPAPPPAAGQVIHRKLPFPLRGSGRGLSPASGTSTSVAGTSGSITVTGLAGNITAVTGSPGQVARSRTRMPPRHGTVQGTRAAAPGTSTAVTGVPGTITVTGFGGSIQAFTGSPGRIARSQPVPSRKGSGHGASTAHVVIIPGSVPGQAGLLTVTAPPGTATGTASVTGQPGQVTVAALPGTVIGVTAVAGTTGTITVAGAGGFVTNVPPRGIRWDIEHGFAPEIWRSNAIQGNTGLITISAPPGTVTATAPATGTITVTALPGTVAATYAAPRYVRWDIERGFAPETWRSNAVQGNTGLIAVTALPGTVVATAPATGQVTVTAPPGTVAASYAAPRYVRWRVRPGFAPETWRSHVVQGNPGLISVTAPPGTVAVQYYTIGPADSAGRMIRSRTLMPPRRGGESK